MKSQTKQAGPESKAAPRKAELYHGPTFSRTAPLQPFRLERNDVLGATGAGLGSFLLYVRTLAPTVTGEDAGEFVAAAYTLGIPHPPGYPLWCLVAKAFTFLPLGNIAYRCNLMSAFFGALCCSLLFLLVVHLTRQRIIALSAALLFACSKEFWGQSLIAEVYTLNLFFTLLIFYLVLAWKASGSTRLLQAAVIAFWVSLSNHYILMLLAIPGYVMLLIHGRTRNQVTASLRQWKQGLPFMALAALPLLIYLYLPLRAAQNPPMNWGNPSTWDSFWAHVLRTSYRSLELERTVAPNIKLLFVIYFLVQWLQQFTWLLLPLAFIGLSFLLERRRDVAYASLTLFLFNTLGLIIGLRFTFERDNLQRFEPYFLTAYAMTALWIGCGLLSLKDRLAASLSSKRHRIWQRASPVLLGAVPALLWLLPLRAHLAENNLRHNYVAYDLARASLDTVGKQAILFPSGDYRAFPLAYCVMVERHRPDVIIADVYGTLHHDVLKLYRQWTKDKALRTSKEIEAALVRGGRRPIYYSMKGDFPEVEGYNLQPEGLWYRVVKEGEKQKPVGLAQAPPVPPADPARTPAPASATPLHEPPGLPRPHVPMPGRRQDGLPGFPHDPLRRLRPQSHLPASSPASLHLPDETPQHWLPKTVRGVEGPSAQLDEMSRACLADYWFFNGLSQFQHGKVDQGLAAFNRVAEIAKDNKETLNNLGSAYAEQGFSQQAEAMYRQAIGLYPDYAMAHANLGRIYDDQGQIDQAAYEYDQASRANPQLAKVRERLRELTHRH